MTKGNVLSLLEENTDSPPGMSEVKQTEVSVLHKGKRGFNTSSNLR